jgi:exodeoxyribonuclease VIII
MNQKEYRSNPAISRSELWRIHQSPLHYQYYKKNPPEPTPSLIFGSAAHTYILEKDKFNDEYAIAPVCDRRTKQGKEDYNAFLATIGNRQAISIEDHKKIIEMRKAIEAHKHAAEILYDPSAKYEQSFFWTDEQTGEAVKCRPDCMVELNGQKWIVDYKTTSSCADGDFERSCRKYGYKLQTGMYREGVFWNTLDDYGFIFIAQESNAPYAIRVYVCSEEFIGEGYDQYRELLGIYHHCKETGVWYGYEGVTGTDTDLLGEEE